MPPENTRKTRRRSGTLPFPAVARAPDGKFAPGFCPNPSGRPKAERDVVELARAHSTEAVQTLVRVMREGKPAEASAAANSILDRAFGKPRQVVDATVRRDIRSLSDDELLAIIAGEPEAEAGSLH